MSEWLIFLFLCFLLYLGFRKIRQIFKFKENYSITEQIEYKIDYLLSQHPEYKTYGLCYLTIVLILVGGVSYYFMKQLSNLFGSDSDTEYVGFTSSMKKSWTFLLDNGAHLEEEGILPVLVAFILSIGGMMIDALLVGLVAEGLAERMDALKQGRSNVLEENHTLILGWNDKVLPMIRELIEAFDSEGGGVIVIMAERDKQEMEEEIQNYFSHDEYRGTVVICRNGNPMLVSDLVKVSADRAKSVAVMASDGDPDESDAKAVRITLALCGGVKVKGHVVVELRDIDNKELVFLVGKEQVEVMVSHDVIGRLMIQCARQQGLAQMYNKLLGFDDNEFYIEKWPTAVGKTFAEVSLLFKDAVACGVRIGTPVGDEPSIFLNPPRDYVIRPDDEILVLAEDDDAYTIADSPSPAARLEKTKNLPDWIPEPPCVETILFCGWRRDLDDMIVELDKCVAPGSELHILSTIPVQNRGELLKEGGLLSKNLSNLKLMHHEGNQVIRRHLETLPIESYDSIMILAEGDADATYADSRSLSSLLLIRDIQQKRTNKECTVISEIMDPRTKQLVSVAQISDYVVSNELVSKSMAMVLEEREINIVLTELFTADGSEIFMRDCKTYVGKDEKANFWQISQRAGFRREILIGWRRKGEDVILNPTNKDEALSWNIDEDIMIVIAVD